MLVSAMLSLIDGLKPGNPYSSSMKTVWINEVEGQLWDEVYKYRAIATYTASTSYSLPTGVDFTDVVEVYAGTNLMPRIDISMKDTTGYYYDKTNNKLVVYPATGYSNVYIVHNIPFVAKTSGDSLSVIAPYDRMYIEYVVAKIEFYSQNYEAYNNTIEAFNQTFAEFKDSITGGEAVEA